MVKDIIVGAHYGLKDWLAQRISAAVMAAYAVLLAVCVLSRGELTQETWRAILSGGFMRFTSFLFIVSLMYHAWVGIRDIWMDYVKPNGVRLVLHVVTLLALIGYAGWAVQILWRL